MSDTSDSYSADSFSLAKKLLDFGLTDTEARVYLYLLNKTPKTIVEISREISLPRTSIYDNAEKLLIKGLLTKVINYKSQKLRALPLSILQTIIDKEKIHLEHLEKNLSFLQKTVSHSLHPSIHTEIKYYHGKQGFMQMMWNTLSAKQEIIRYPEFGRIDIVGEKFFRSWTKQILEQKITERALVNPQAETLRHFFQTDEYSLRSKYQKTRMLSQDTLHISGDTTMYNGTFAVCFWKQGEIVGIEIENPELVNMQKSIFQTLWKISQPITKKITAQFINS